jgi:ABC-type transporter lipoprotein component MlaA
MININVGGGIIDTAGLMQVLREAQRMGDTL